MRFKNRSDKLVEIRTINSHKIEKKGKEKKKGVRHCIPNSMNADTGNV